MQCSFNICINDVCVVLCTVVFFCNPDASVYLVGSDIKGGTFAPDSTTSEDHAIYFFGKYSKDLLVEVGVHCIQMYLRSFQMLAQTASGIVHCATWFVLRFPSLKITSFWWLYFHLSECLLCCIYPNIVCA